MAQDKSRLFLNAWQILTPGQELPVAEFRFSPPRRWRFDWSFPAAKVAVEVNGNAWHTRGGGRHGQARDLEKINAAQSQGWRVFQFSPAMLIDNPAECVRIVVEALQVKG